MFDGIRIGIYGARKKYLFVLLLVLTWILVINISVTIWMLRIIHFSFDGIGPLSVHGNTVRLESQAIFNENVWTNNIKSRPGEPLYVHSTSNITLSSTRLSRDSAINSQMVIGEKEVEIVAEEFIVHNSKGKLLFRADQQDTTVAAHTLRINGANGVRFDRSVQAPVVKFDDGLNIESSTNDVYLESPKGIHFHSKTKHVRMSASHNLTLRSENSVIMVESEEIFLQNIKTPIASKTGKPYGGIYQLCICENGKLFLASPVATCKADPSVCLSRSQTTEAHV